MPRARGSKNRRTVERETAKRVAAARAELVKNAPPLDFSMPLDSLDVMEHAMRHFYFRAKIEERLGDQAEWRRVDEAFMQAVHVAEKVARYRHAHLSAIKLAGDINARVADDVSLDELLVKDQRGTGEARAAHRSRRDPRRTRRGKSFAGDGQRERTRGDFATTPAAAGHGCFIRVEFSQPSRGIAVVLA